jgi:hypothetical protein
MSDSGIPGFSFTRIPSAPTATNPDTLFVQVPGNPRYLTFRSYSLLAPKPAAARPNTEPPAPRPPPPPPPPARLYPVTPAADPEELSAELCQAMDFIMSGMTPDELSWLFQVSDRYRNYHAAKIARHAPPPPPPAHDDPGRVLYEYRAARDAARAAASHSLPTTYRQASPVLATATAGGAAEILADGAPALFDAAAVLAAPEVAIPVLLAPPAFATAEVVAKALRSADHHADAPTRLGRAVLHAFDAPEPSPPLPGLVPPSLPKTKPGEGGFTAPPHGKPVPGFTPAPPSAPVHPGHAPVENKPIVLESQGGGTSNGKESTLAEVLAPGGSPVGVVNRGARQDTRTVPPNQFNALKAELLRDAKPIADGEQYDRYDGKIYILPNGEVFGLRISDPHGETIDIFVSKTSIISKRFKVHQK